MPRHDPPSGQGGPSRAARPVSADPRSDPGLKAAIRDARDLKTPQGRREQGRFLIEGVRLVEDALKQDVPLVGAFITPHLLEGTPRGRDLARWLRAGPIPILDVGERILSLVADTETPAGIVAVAELPEPPAQLPAPRGSGIQVVLFDGLRDPGNAGGIVRSAAAAGVSHLVSTQGCVDLWAPKVVRAGAGAHFRVVLHVAVPGDLVEEWLTQWPQVVVADGAARTSIYAVDWQQPTVLILGNEAHGPSSWPAGPRLVRARIPMRAETESLNVAAAAAVLLYEGRRHLLRDE